MKQINDLQEHDTTTNNSTNIIDKNSSIDLTCHTDDSNKNVNTTTDTTIDMDLTNTSHTDSNKNLTTDTTAQIQLSNNIDLTTEREQQTNATHTEQSETKSIESDLSCYDRLYYDNDESSPISTSNSAQPSKLLQSTSQERVLASDFRNRVCCCVQLPSHYQSHSWLFKE